VGGISKHNAFSLYYNKYGKETNHTQMPLQIADPNCMEQLNWPNPMELHLFLAA
jgi:hypothetical protein